MIRCAGHGRRVCRSVLAARAIGGCSGRECSLPLLRPLGVIAQLRAGVGATAGDKGRVEAAPRWRAAALIAQVEAPADIVAGIGRRAMRDEFVHQEHAALLHGQCHDLVSGQIIIANAKALAPEDGVV